ncbi:hypothetical protein E6R60_26815 [Streptomyces sp. A0642]|uniref:hypothetical protein n=1 Tax=Streptomyces sp. A0642 TaxID=2563100 RepID=UPI0010A288EE|nr:hypothetical protein [Streptomyces sp. A0642]THA72543.1 hypothetical protein E6R60_26815 [Streptomyces sp. A0642]
MAKRKNIFLPRPNTIWHTSGRSPESDLSELVGEHLAQLAKTGVIQTHRRHAGDVREGLRVSSFDAGWRTDDGARVSARLNLFRETPPVELLSVLQGRGRSSWTVTAEADRPWNMAWESPARMFFPADREQLWARDYFAGALRLGMASALVNDLVHALPEILSCLAVEGPWYTVVITHDKHARVDHKGLDLVPMLPDSFYGSVVEIRAQGSQDRIFNDVLAAHNVSLPSGGAVILPTNPRKEGWRREDYVVYPRGGDFESTLKKTAQLVERYAQEPSHFNGLMRDCVDDLHYDWVLPQVELAPDQILAQKAEVEESAARLRQELEDARRKLHAEAEARKEAEKSATVLRNSVARLEREMREHPLADQARAAEERLAEISAHWEEGQLLLDDQTSQIAWLRRQLAQVPGRTYDEPVPEPAAGPESWDELVEFTEELMPHVRIGDVSKPLRELRGHKKEKQWLRKTWESLEALEAYAEAKKKLGADVLPHFTQYLNWPEAPVLVSKQLYCASDLRSDGSDSKVRKTRLFHVPGQGQVFMGEHFRIGGVVPPAPRMHVHDDTAGPSGLIHVGYIGPHLPNKLGR